MDTVVDKTDTVVPQAVSIETQTDTVQGTTDTVVDETVSVVETIDPVATGTAPLERRAAAPRDHARDFLRSTFATATTTLSLFTRRSTPSAHVGDRPLLYVPWDIDLDRLSHASPHHRPTDRRSRRHHREEAVPIRSGQLDACAY